MPNEAFFHQNPKLLGLGRQLWQTNFEAFVVFLANSSALWYSESLVHGSISQPLFLQKTKPLYPNIYEICEDF